MDSDPKWHAAVAMARAKNMPLFFANYQNTTLNVDTNLGVLRMWCKNHVRDSRYLRIYRRSWNGVMEREVY